MPRGGCRGNCSRPVRAVPEPRLTRRRAPVLGDQNHATPRQVVSHAVTGLIAWAVGRGELRPVCSVPFPGVTKRPTATVHDCASTMWIMSHRGGVTSRRLVARATSPPARCIEHPGGAVREQNGLHPRRVERHGRRHRGRGCHRRGHSMPGLGLRWRGRRHQSGNGSRCEDVHDLPGIEEAAGDDWGRAQVWSGSHRVRSSLDPYGFLHHSRTHSLPTQQRNRCSLDRRLAPHRQLRDLGGAHFRLRLHRWGAAQRAARKRGPAPVQEAIRATGT
jgi:hypothetical protein